MAKEPKRISLALFDEELKTLINTSAKIFPMSQEDIDNNLNPNNYEYAKVGRAIYSWHDDKWDYIIADDIEVLWTDIQGKPLTFPPTNHEHGEEEITNLDKYSKSEVDNLLADKAGKNELHSHENKSLLDGITQALINAWDSAVTHISDIVRHVTQADKDKWDAVVNKADKTYVDTALEDKADKTYVDIELNKKSPLGHDHDGAYYKKDEVDSKLSSKSNIGHTHTELDIHINDDIIHISPQDRENWDSKSPFKYEQEFLELRDHYGYMNINGGNFDGNDGYYLMIDGGEF